MAAITYHHFLQEPLVRRPYIWVQEELSPFDELIISWNAGRPDRGKLHISVSVKIEGTWSPFFSYASWGSQYQYGGNVESNQPPLHIKQDILEIKEGKRAVGFKIRVDLESDHLIYLYALHACTSLLQDLSSHPFPVNPEVRAIDLDVPGLSQMVLPHMRHRDMCSPSATSALISYFLKMPPKPIDFALRVRDEAFDIFGNWVLNIAEASSILGEGWACWVDRLKGFEDLYKSIQRGYPVVVSVRGYLRGSPLMYEQGHLIVVRGFEPSGQRVLCVDPAFASDGESKASYSLEDFLNAWQRRNYVAYRFEKRENSLIHLNKMESSQK